jgi:hypothetical protein
MDKAGNDSSRRGKVIHATPCIVPYFVVFIYIENMQGGLRPANDFTADG